MSDKPADTPAPAPFALLKLTDLKVIRFQHREDLQAAVSQFAAHEVPTIPLTYHAGAGLYSAPVVVS